MKIQFQICILVLCFISISICIAQPRVSDDVRFKNLKNVTPEPAGSDAIIQTDFFGTEANGLYGNSVSGAGDVNGDGLADFIIAAHNYNSGQGRAYIYFGKTNMTNLPELIFTGQNIGDYFATSVSGAGDVNGDGYSDIIVGAPGFDTSAGRAYIYFGGANMNNTADVILSGINSNDNFGNCVASAGDVNGDGISDVIAGAYWYNNLTGRAYIYFGGSSMNNVSDVTLTGEALSNQFGVTVAGAGDVNGDGYSDIISGADGNNSGTGKAYIYFGGNPMNNIADVTVNGESIYDGFGHSVSGAGDVNGDTYSDFIIGASGSDSGGTYSGRVYIYYGGATVNNIADFIFTGGENDLFGASVSGAGDVNGDGYSDILLSAVGENNYTGAVYIVLGGITMYNYISLDGSNSGDYFGTSISGCGDVNGDGNSDVITGLPFYNSNTGRAYLYMKSASASANPSWVKTGVSSGTFYGSSVSSAGDVNGDGYDDVIVGAPLGYADRGIAYIYYGGVVTDTADDVTLFGDGFQNNFGTSVSSAGDVNGDGFDDVIVGADGYNQDKGRAYIFYGGISMNNVPDILLDGETIGDLFGYSVSLAGDVNADGYSDVIVGAINYIVSTGKAYIFYGGSAMNNVADVSLLGETINNHLGRSVSGAGDVNDDGYDDVIVGAEGFSSNEGRAYIYFGNNIMDNVADVIMTGEAAQNIFGYCVSGAGDVNDDGYSDVLVSAPWFGSEKGRAYMYYGGAVMNNISDVIFTGETPGDESGRSVSAAGDLNNDGYSDVIIGVDKDNGSTGSALIFYGGAVLDNLEDITLKGEIILSYFGTSVSSAGDLNIDGYPDIIIGADGYNSGIGRAYVFLSPSNNISITLTAFIQGFFNQNTGTQVSDTVKVFLRNASAPYSIVDSSKSILSSNGTSSLKFIHASSGNYYLVLRHRNSIETWSRNGGETLTRGSAFSYNFANAISKAYRNNMIIKGFKYCIYSGDVTQEGNVDLTDVISIFNDASNFTNGYVKTDIDGNNTVDLNDLIIAFNNSSGFIRVMKP